MPQFAANLTMMFTDAPFRERFSRAAQAGFKGVEFLFPYEHAPEEIAGWLKDNRLTNVLFNLPPGDWGAGERGLASLPGRETEFRGSVEQALDYARLLGTPRLHAMAGLFRRTRTGRGTGLRMSRTCVTPHGSSPRKAARC